MRRFASALAAAALVFSTAGTAVAAPASSPPTAANAQQPSPWLALSMLTPAATIGLGGAVAQPGNGNDQAPPPPPVFGSVQSPPVPVIAVWLATVAMAVYILSHEHHGRFIFPHPNSPG